MSGPQQGSELRDLRAFSERLGADFTLVQGAGGNTSVKEGTELIVKASGKRLADALKEEVFVRVPLAWARDMSGAAPPVANGLRPSIETSLHAVLPHRVVAHVHAVDVIAWAVRADAEARLAPMLAGLRWSFVPYVRPGQPLADAVLAAPPADVYVLGNHGLIVGADDFDACERLIREVAARLAISPRMATAPAGALADAEKRLDLEAASFPEAHWAALEHASMRAALAGTLYPDHVVFLGRGAHALAADAPPPASDAPAVYLVAGCGALLPKNASLAAHEMAACLGMVAARVAPDAALRTLSRAHEDELLGWDAEKHRQQLAGA